LARSSAHSGYGKKIRQNRDEGDFHVGKLQEILGTVLKSSAFITFPAKYTVLGWHLTQQIGVLQFVTWVLSPETFGNRSAHSRCAQEHYLASKKPTSVQDTATGTPLAVGLTAFSAKY